MKRRRFFRDSLKAIGITLLSYVPGTFFGTRKAFAQKSTDDFKKLLASTNSTNVYGILSKSTLSQEEKIAILAMRELKREDVQTILNDLGNPRVKGIGHACGNNCSTAIGNVCGFGCSTNQGARGVLDKTGQLKMDLKTNNLTTLKNLMQEALNLTK